MVGFVSGDELQVNTHCLCQVDQKWEKVTVMMIRRCQHRDNRKTVTGFGINGGQGMQPVADDID